MLKLKKKVFFTGLTLAILMPIVAQAADTLNKMEVGFCDQTNMLRGCNPSTYVDVSMSDHKTRIMPLLNSSNPAFVGFCTKNAIADFWGKFEQIRQDSAYKAAVQDYNNSCVANLKRGKKAPFVPQPIIVANIIRNVNNKTHPQVVYFYGKIVGPDGEALTGLFGNDKDKALRYNSEVLKKKSSTSLLDDDDDKDTDKDQDDAVACPDEKDFVDGLLATDDDNSESQVTRSAKKLASEIEQLAADCKAPIDQTRVGSPSFDKLSDTLSVPTLEEKIEGGSRAGSGA